MSWIPTLDQARDLVYQYNQEPFHRKHAEVVSGVMGYFARQYDPEQEEFWKAAGIMHDLDFEQFPEEHCIRCQQIMRELDIDEALIHAVACHAHGIMLDLPPVHIMEKILFAADELTGLIGAAALIRPSKSVCDMEVKSVKKKYKSPAFAAGCSREVIEAGANMLGWTLDELLARTLEAMRSLCAEMDI